MKINNYIRVKRTFTFLSRCIYPRTNPEPVTRVFTGEIFRVDEPDAYNTDLTEHLSNAEALVLSVKEARGEITIRRMK